MSGWSATADTSVFRHPIGWLLSRLTVYVCVAALSGFVFLVGATIYSYLSPPVSTIKAPPQPTPKKPILFHRNDRTQEGPRIASLKFSNGENLPVSRVLKQTVYDVEGKKVGVVLATVPDSNGAKVDSLVVGLGGFLGAGEKNVAIPVNKFKLIDKGNDVIYVAVEATPDSLQGAPLYRYDAARKSWIPE